MRGGSYKTDVDGKRQRLNRITGQWEPCDDQGNVDPREPAIDPGPEIESSTEEE